MTSHIDIGDIGGSGPLRLVSVSKTSGVLTAIGVSGGPRYHYFTVTIDGTLLGRQDYLSGVLSGPAHGNNGLGVGLPFEQSLDVMICNMKPFPQARFWAAYITKGSEIIDETYSTRIVDGIEYEYVQRQYRASPDTEPYSVESLAGPRRWSRILLREDLIFPGEELRGRLLITSGGDPGPPNDAISIVLQLPGTVRPILRHGLESAQSSQFTWTSDNLESRLSEMLRAPRSAWPRPFELQVAADIPGFVNYPTGFSLL
jgi:hypothetical protein